MSFQILQSGTIKRAHLGALGADLTLKARTVPGFGRGIAIGFLTGLVVAGSAVGWLLTHIRV